MVNLTAGELNILVALASYMTRPLSRDFLLDVISNRDPREISEDTVDTLIVRLRRKMRRSRRCAASAMPWSRYSRRPLPEATGRPDLYPSR